MMLRHAFLAAVIVCCAASEALAQRRYGYGTDQGRGGGAEMTGGLGVRYRYWTAELDGDIEAEDAGVAGSDLSLDSHLGLDEKQKLSDIGVWLPLLPIVGKLHVQYWWGTFEGDNQIGSDVTFAGRTFTAGSVLDTEMKWTSWAFLWEYTQEGPTTALAGFAGSTGVTAQLGLKYVTVDTSVSDNLGNGESAKMVAWIPVVGVVGGMTLSSFLSINIELTGAQAVGISGVKGTHFDAAVSLGVHIKGFHAGAGYRWFKFDVTDESPKGADELDLDLYVEGIFFEAGIRF